MKDIFTEHPKSQGETYWQYGTFAFWNALLMLLGTVYYAVYPNRDKTRLLNKAVKYLRHRHCERSAAIQRHQKALDCRASLAMTVLVDVILRIHKTYFFTALGIYSELSFFCKEKRVICLRSLLKIFDSVVGFHNFK